MEALATPSRLHYVRTPTREPPLDRPYEAWSPAWIEIEPGSELQASFSFEGELTFWWHYLDEQGERQLVLFDDLHSADGWRQASYEATTEAGWVAVGLEVAVNGSPRVARIDGFSLLVAGD